MNPNKSKKEKSFDTISLSPGISIGPAFLFRRFSFDLHELDINISNTDREIKVFRNACSKTIQNLEETMQMSQEIYGDEFQEIFESQIELLKDQIFLKEIENEIKKQKKPAAFVVFKVFGQNQGNTYWRFSVRPIY